MQEGCFLHFPVINSISEELEKTNTKKERSVLVRVKFGALAVWQYCLPYFLKAAGEKPCPKPLILQVWETCFKAVASRDAQLTPVTLPNSAMDIFFPTSSCTQVNLEMYFHGKFISDEQELFLHTSKTIS